MKNLSPYLLVLTSLISNVVIGQNNYSLKEFENKKIISTQESSTTSGPKEGVTAAKDSKSIPLTIGKSTQEQRKERVVTIKSNGKNKGWKVNLSVKKLHVLVIREDGQKSVYDSENMFERDPMANEIGRKYDSFIGKVVIENVNNEGKTTSDAKINSSYTDFWTNKIPIFQTSATWEAGIIFPNKNLSNYSVNFKWEDTLKMEKKLSFTKYTVSKIENNEITLLFNTIVKSVDTVATVINSGKFEEKDGSYDGQIIVDKKTLFITNATIEKKEENDLTILNSLRTISVKTKYIIKNIITDL